LVLMLGGGGSEPDRAAVSGAPKLNRTIPAGSVANVGDAHVTKAAFRHWDAVSARKSGASTARTQTMQFLISAEWLTQESAKRGIATTPREVRATFDKQKRKSFSSEAAYQRFVRTSGQTEADLLYRVKLSLLTNKLQSDVTKGAPPVTDQQVSDYYDKNRQRFARPETRDLLVILNPRRAEADAAARALESGATWSTVARRYSTDGASRSQGGRLPGVTKGQQERTFDDAIFTAPAGSVEGPVKTQFGYYVFKVTRIHPASQQSLPQVRNAIRQQLTSQREQKGLNDFVNDFQKRYRAATWCATGYVVDQCANGGELRPSTSMPAPSGP